MGRPARSQPRLPACCRRQTAVCLHGVCGAVPGQAPHDGAALTCEPPKRAVEASSLRDGNRCAQCSATCLYHRAGRRDALRGRHAEQQQHVSTSAPAHRSLRSRCGVGVAAPALARGTAAGAGSPSPSLAVVRRIRRVINKDEKWGRPARRPSQAESSSSCRSCEDGILYSSAHVAAAPAPWRCDHEKPNTVPARFAAALAGLGSPARIAQHVTVVLDERPSA